MNKKFSVLKSFLDTSKNKLIILMAINQNNFVTNSNLVIIFLTKVEIKILHSND